MKLYAIKGPNGKIMEGSVRATVNGAWDASTYLLCTDHPLYIEWMNNDFPGDFAAGGERLGYRCVEVEIVEVKK